MSETELPLRVLHLEDNPWDAVLISETLEAQGLICDILRVDTEALFRSALDGGGSFDVIICDYHLPAYDGISALELALRKRPGIPVLLISGTLDEGEAVKALQRGATDYLIKARLHRLGPAIRRALEDAERRRDQRRAEEALRISEERFRLLVENSSDLVWEASLDGRFFYASPNFRTMLGWESAKLVGGGLLDLVHPEDLAQVRAALQKPDLRAEFRCRHEDGSYRWIEVTGRVFRAPGGEERLGATGRDVTGRRLLEEQLRQSQKMETIGQLAGGVAHDFNNILTIIQGQAALLRDDAALSGQARDASMEILEAANRAGSLTRQLLTFSRKQVMQLRGLDLNAVVADMARMLRRILGKGTVLDVQTAGELPPIHADQGMIEQILLNLAVNARDAMPEGGRLSIVTSLATVAEAGAPELGDPCGSLVCLRVSDTGCGIPPEYLERVFEPFFTTKDVNKGTGLGLATVRGIVQQHRGRIRLASVLGRGTVFEILLPAGAMAARPPESDAAGALDGTDGSETILVVDDEPAVLALMSLVLQQHGYHVLEAASGKQALALYDANCGLIDLVLTDMSMPDGMSGRDLAEDLRERESGLQMMFTSGYSADFVNEKLGEHEAFRLLQKPFSPRKLVEAVRACLDGAAASPARA